MLALGARPRPLAWTGILGPRQEKAFKKALAAISIEAHTHDEIGRDGFRVEIYEPYSPGGAAHIDRASVALKQIGERWAWTATGLSCQAIIGELKAALQKLSDERPCVDLRLRENTLQGVS